MTSVVYGRGDPGTTPAYGRGDVGSVKVDMSTLEKSPWHNTRVW